MGEEEDEEEEPEEEEKEEEEVQTVEVTVMRPKLWIGQKIDTRGARCKGAPLKIKGKKGQWGKNWGNLGVGVSEEECKNACLAEPSCNFAVFQSDNGHCSAFDSCSTPKVGKYEKGENKGKVKPFVVWEKIVEKDGSPKEEEAPPEEEEGPPAEEGNNNNKEEAAPPEEEGKNNNNNNNEEEAAPPEEEGNNNNNNNNEEGPPEEEEEVPEEEEEEEEEEEAPEEEEEGPSEAEKLAEEQAKKKKLEQRLAKIDGIISKGKERME